MPNLVVLSEGFSGRSYELKVESTTVGRLEDNAFQIGEPSVSSHHCVVMLRGNEVVVRDLNSTNGSYINGERITEASLKPGQILRLGQVELRLEGSTTSTASDKKVSSQTRVISQGVKRDDLEHGTQPVKFETKSPFSKRNNKTTLIFITVGVILGVIILAFLVWAFFNLGGS